MNLRTHAATPRDMLKELDESSVLVADELTPSLAAQVDWTKVRGFATDAGSRTYHTAILARSLDVPAVVGLHNASEQVQAGQMVVIDGSLSELIIDPTAEDLLAARDLRRRFAEALEKLSPRQRAVFVLRHDEGESLEEIGEALNLDVGTVKAHLARALSKLREELRDLYGS